MVDSKPNSFFTWLGNASGKFFNAHQSYQTAPTWMKAHYSNEVGQLGGDIDTVYSGAVKGLIVGGVEYAKKCPCEAATMGADIANTVGIEKGHGIAFAEGFLETAKLA